MLRAIINNITMYEKVEIGRFRGFPIAAEKDSIGTELMIEGEKSYQVEMKVSDAGNIIRLENTLNGLDKMIETISQKMENYRVDMKNAKIEYEKEFQYEDLLKEMLQRQTEINTQLELKEEKEVIYEEIEEADISKQAGIVR
ncbi:MAG: hypothetical protein ACK5MN_02655 [Lachnospiraceae bacterium]